jgi:hypothetical protein
LKKNLDQVYSYCNPIMYIKNHEVSNIIIGKLHARPHHFSLSFASFARVPRTLCVPDPFSGRFSPSNFARYSLCFAADWVSGVFALPDARYIPPRIAAPAAPKPNQATAPMDRVWCGAYAPAVLVEDVKTGETPAVVPPPSVGMAVLEVFVLDLGTMDVMRGIEVAAPAAKDVNGTALPATAEAPAKAGEPVVAPSGGAAASFGFNTLIKPVSVQRFLKS